MRVISTLREVRWRCERPSVPETERSILSADEDSNMYSSPARLPLYVQVGGVLVSQGQVRLTAEGWTTHRLI